MTSIPAAWTVAESARNSETASYHIRVETSLTKASGTDWPHGCRWCGRSNSRDTVEYCEALEGVVHADCHEERCTSVQCAITLCTTERCDFRDECEGCGADVCRQHSTDECLC